MRRVNKVVVSSDTSEYDFFDESYDDNQKAGDRVTVEVMERRAKQVKPAPSSGVSKALHQIDDDVYLRRCIYSREKLAEYLVALNLDVKQFIRECNREGLTFDQVVRKWIVFNEEDPYGKLKYTYFQSIKIHARNKDEINIEQFQNQLKELKQPSRKQLLKEKKLNIFMREQEAKEKEKKEQQIQQRKQDRLRRLRYKNFLKMRELNLEFQIKIEDEGNRNQPIDLNKDYITEPLEELVDEDLVLQWVQEFEMERRAMVIAFEEEQIRKKESSKIKKIQIDDDDYSQCIDVNAASDDSLNEPMKMRPCDRDPQYWSMNLQYATTKVIELDIVCKKTKLLQEVL